MTGGLVLLAGCSIPSQGTEPGSARLSVQYSPPTTSIAPGTYPLDEGRDGYLVVPQSYDPAVPATLVVALHGAGIGAMGPVDFLGPFAEERGFILLAVQSRDFTWDAIHRSFGPDVAVIDRLLRHVFERCAIDPNGIVLEGFSDGASYALGLGLANGDLFSRIIAFSPGFIAPSSSPDVGKPRIFISHGRQDPVLPFASTSEFIVPTLRFLGYGVTFVPYEGVHSVPYDIANQAVLWFLTTD